MCVLALITPQHEGQSEILLNHQKQTWLPMSLQAQVPMMRFYHQSNRPCMSLFACCMGKGYWSIWIMQGKHYSTTNMSLLAYPWADCFNRMKVIKRAHPSVVPQCRNVLQMKIKHKYITMMWKSSHLPSPCIQDAISHCGTFQNGQLAINWYRGIQFSQNIEVDHLPVDDDDDDMDIGHSHT